MQADGRDGDTTKIGMQKFLPRKKSAD